MGQEMYQNSSNENIVCEAVGCSTRATKKIIVEVGQQGKILLHVCQGCLYKFGDGSLV